MITAVSMKLSRSRTITIIVEIIVGRILHSVDSMGYFVIPKASI